MNDTEELNKYYLQKEQEEQDSLLNSSLQKRERLSRLLKSLDRLPKNPPVEPIGVFEKTQPLLPLASTKPSSVIQSSKPKISSEDKTEVPPLPLLPIVKEQPSMVSEIKKMETPLIKTEVEPPKPTISTIIKIQEPTIIKAVEPSSVDKKPEEIKSSVFVAPEIKLNPEIEVVPAKKLVQPQEEVIKNFDTIAPLKFEQIDIEQNQEEQNVSLMLYESGFEPAVDKAILSCKMIVNSHTTWLEVADCLAKNHFINEAEVARIYADEDGEDESDDEEIENPESNSNEAEDKPRYARRRKVGRPRKRGRPRIHRVRKKIEKTNLLTTGSKNGSEPILKPPVVKKEVLNVIPSSSANENLYEKLNSLTSIGADEEQKLHNQAVERMTGLMEKAKEHLTSEKEVTSSDPLMKILSPEVQKIYEQTLAPVKIQDIPEKKEIEQVLQAPVIKEAPVKQETIVLPEISKNTLPVHVPTTLFPNTPEPKSVEQIAQPIKAPVSLPASLMKLVQKKGGNSLGNNPVQPVQNQQPVQKTTQTHATVLPRNEAPKNLIQPVNQGRANPQPKHQIIDHELMRKTQKSLARARSRAKFFSFCKTTLLFLSYLLIPLCSVLFIFSFPEVVKFYQERDFTQNIMSIGLLVGSLAIVWHYIIKGLTHRKIAHS